MSMYEVDGWRQGFRYKKPWLGVSITNTETGYFPFERTNERDAIIWCNEAKRLHSHIYIFIIWLSALPEVRSKVNQQIQFISCSFPIAKKKKKYYFSYRSPNKLTPFKLTHGKCIVYNGKCFLVLVESHSKIYTEFVCLMSHYYNWLTNACLCVGVRVRKRSLE